MAKTFQKWYAGFSGRYELTNHILTFGLDVLWRRSAAGIVMKTGGKNILDLCSGTGDFARELHRRSTDGNVIYVSDVTLSMIKRAAEKTTGGQIRCSVCEAGQLPFKDGTFDIITVTFAARNLNSSKKMFLRRLSEINRVLKPGGLFFNLETSQPSNKILRFLFYRYVKYVIPPVGGLISGAHTAFKYLAASIPRFYAPEELAEILKTAGFSEVSFTLRHFGIAALHKAVK